MSEKWDKIFRFLKRLRTMTLGRQSSLLYSALYPTLWGLHSHSAPALYVMLTSTQMLFISFFFFWPCLVACGILVPWSVMEPMVLAFEARNLNHWTTREIPEQILLCIYFLLLCKAHVVPFKHSKIWGTFYFCLQMVTLSRQTWFLTQCVLNCQQCVPTGWSL